MAYVCVHWLFRYYILRVGAWRLVHRHCVYCYCVLYELVLEE